ncbi:Tetratricopeptide repeat (TPR)-like superfamily protein [Euphorbia peplus]|nr:Tetratricopeptide repeat (TPR)-like superfamily protein [Euphorbia peplus]
MAGTDLAVQAAILILALALFIAIQYFPKQALQKLRAKNRTHLQSNRHFIQGTHLLSRAKSTLSKSQSQSHSLAKNALLEAESAISLSPRDSAPFILKALALDLLGHKASALKALDLALSSPRVKSLEDRDRGDALVKRAELKIAVNRKRRVDSAIDDLKEAVELCGDREKAFRVLGQCYESKGMKEEAECAFMDATKSRVQPL